MDCAARVPVAVVDSLSDTVGRAFIKQYYYILSNMPEHLHRFYQDISKVGRVGEDGSMHEFSTLEGISEGIKTWFYGEFRSAEIISFDSQDSYNGGILLLVTGYFTLNERLRRKFRQTFFLAPQENGYFVLNDMLRFVNEPESVDGEVVLAQDLEPPAPVTAAAGNKSSEEATCVPVSPVCKEVTKSLNNENASVAKANILVPEIINEDVPINERTCKEVADDSLKVSFPDGRLEYVPKKSYASVLKVTKDRFGVSAASSLSTKQIAKSQEHQASSDPFPEQVLKDQDHQASSDPSPVIEPDAVSEVVDATENGHNQGSEAVAEGTSVYVKHLPTNVTIDMLETELKQFGAISKGGVQVINQRGNGFPYGFVEFEDADAAKKAIEASPIRIGGQRAFVEEKRSTLRGNRERGNAYGNRHVLGGRGSYGYGDNYKRRGRFFNRGNQYSASINTY